MANKLGAEFDKEEGRFNSLAKSARTDHICFACPSYLLKSGETGKSELLIAKCWKAATAPFVERHSSLHQMLIVRACCVSLHITSSKSELVDHVLSVVAAEKPDGGAIAKLRFAALAAELPIKPETQAELIGDFYLRVKEQWTQKEDPEVKVVEDGTNLAMMLATCGRAVDQLLTDTSQVNLSPLRVETILSKFKLDAHQMKIDSLTLCVKVPDINLAFCLLSQTITQELLMRIPVCNPEQREALAFILRGVILNLSVVNQEKEQAADLAIDALTAFMAKPDFYMNCTDLIVDLACEGVEANMEVFGRDSIDTQNMMYRLGKIVAAPHRISKLDGALQQLIDQAAAARLEAKKAKAASEQGRLLSQQVALLMLARKTAPVSALRKAATLTQHERAIKLLTEHAQYLGGDVRDTTAEFKHTKREQAIYLIERVVRARLGAKKLQQMVEAAHFAEQERLAKDAKQRREAATVIQRKYIKFTAIVRAKAELQRLRRRFAAILQAQAAIRALASRVSTRLRLRVAERKRQTRVLQRVYRSRQAAAALHVDYLRFTAPNVDFLGPLVRDWHYFGYPALGARQRAEMVLTKPQVSLLKPCYCADALRHLQFEESHGRMGILREWKLLILKEQHMEDRYKSWIRVVAPLLEKRTQRAKETASPPKQPQSQEEGSGKRILSGTEAASMIQRAWRCNMARFELRFRRLRFQYYREVKRRILCAVKVQSLIRGFICRRRLAGNRSAKTQTE